MSIIAFMTRLSRSGTSTAAWPERDWRAWRAGPPSGRTCDGQGLWAKTLQNGQNVHLKTHDRCPGLRSDEHGVLRHGRPPCCHHHRRGACTAPRCSLIAPPSLDVGAVELVSLMSGQWPITVRLTRLRASTAVVTTRRSPEVSAVSLLQYQAKIHPSNGNSGSTDRWSSKGVAKPLGITHEQSSRSSFALRYPLVTQQRNPSAGRLADFAKEAAIM